MQSYKILSISTSYISAVRLGKVSLRPGIGIEKGDSQRLGGLSPLSCQLSSLVYCRDTRIRTWDPLLPKQVR